MLPSDNYIDKMHVSFNQVSFLLLADLHRKICHSSISPIAEGLNDGCLAWQFHIFTNNISVMSRLTGGWLCRALCDAVL